MESLSQWLAENGSALWTTIISFMSVYGVALISLVIGIIRTKLSAIAQEKASNEKFAKLTQELITRLNEVESAVIEASNVNTEKRIKAMQNIADTVNAANDALKEATSVDSTSNNVNAALEALE